MNNSKGAQTKGAQTKRQDLSKQIVERVNLLSKLGLISIEQVEKVAGIRAKDFLRLATMLPWLTVETKNRQFQFTINQPLQELCEFQTSREELNGQSFADFFQTLRTEISRRREKANYRRSRSVNRWSPQHVVTTELCQIVDYIENELDKINLRQSANAQEGAVSLQQEAKGNSDGQENRIQTGPSDKGPCQEILHDEITSGGEKA